MGLSSSLPFKWSEHARMTVRKLHSSCDSPRAAQKEGNVIESHRPRSANSLQATLIPNATDACRKRSLPCRASADVSCSPLRKEIYTFRTSETSSPAPCIHWNDSWQSRVLPLPAVPVTTVMASSPNTFRQSVSNCCEPRPKPAALPLADHTGSTRRICSVDVVTWALPDFP